MIEYQTKGLVLDKTVVNEFDYSYVILTAELGKVRAKAASAGKITSKLAGQLEPGSFSSLRLVKKTHDSNLRLAEALLIDKICGPEYVRTMDLINSIIPFEFPDEDFFTGVTENLLSGKNDSNLVLSLAGYDPKYAKCGICGSEKIVYFSKSNIIFLCQSCLSRSLRNAQEKQSGVSF